MTVETMLSQLSKRLVDSGEQERAGVIHIALDRERELARQIGYKGILNLVRQMRKLLEETCESELLITRFGLSALVVQVVSAPSGGLQELAQALFDGLRTHSFKVGSRRIAGTVSMSVCRFDPRFSDADELLLALVERSEELAQEGGNALSFVEPSVSTDQALSSNEYMLGLLMDALGHDKLKVVFQPLLAIEESESFSAYEMFPRLQADDGQLISAAEFIPLAREAALLPALDRWMLTHAMRLLRENRGGRDLCLFINQSESLFSDESRREWFRELLEQSPDLEHRIVLELSMDDVMMHLDSAAKLIRDAQLGGIGICISRVDERSRWDLLSGDLACKYLKISPNFVTKLVQHRDLEARFREMSAPVREVGTRIIMPMVENSATAASMWRAGADYMQGNMIQKPEDTIAISR